MMKGPKIIIRIQHRNTIHGIIFHCSLQRPIEDEALKKCLIASSPKERLMLLWKL